MYISVSEKKEKKKKANMLYQFTFSRLVVWMQVVFEFKEALNTLALNLHTANVRLV